MIKCQLSSPGLIPRPLKPKPKLILTQFQGWTLSTASVVRHVTIEKEFIIENKIEN